VAVAPAHSTFDTITSTFLNASGVDLGLTQMRGIGAVSLYQKAVVTTSLISRTVRHGDAGRHRSPPGT
jgi:hypothetical protein